MVCYDIKTIISDQRKTKANKALGNQIDCLISKSECKTQHRLSEGQGQSRRNQSDILPFLFYSSEKSQGENNVSIRRAFLEYWLEKKHFHLFKHKEKHSS